MICTGHRVQTHLKCCRAIVRIQVGCMDDLEIPSIGENQNCKAALTSKYWEAEVVDGLSTGVCICCCQALHESLLYAIAKPLPSAQSEEGGQSAFGMIAGPSWGHGSHGEQPSLHHYFTTHWCTRREIQTLSWTAHKLTLGVLCWVSHANLHTSCMIASAGRVKSILQRAISACTSGLELLQDR